ncbi:MAG TPA: GtrA family protein [Baekduia sp.]|nr:GtrA family protein [Baekduia sp.]
MGITRTLTATRSRVPAPIAVFLTRETLRYIIGGSFTTVVYVGMTLTLARVVDAPIQLAIPVSYATALLLHFLLQRNFVFQREDGFTLERGHQLRRYLSTAATQYSLAALSTALLPDILGLHEQVVYVVTALTLAAATFLILRTHVFH